MTSADADREPVTRRAHDRPWVADHESEAHAADGQLTVAEAVDAVEQTRAGGIRRPRDPRTPGTGDSFTRR